MEAWMVISPELGQCMVVNERTTDGLSQSLGVYKSQVDNPLAYLFHEIIIEFFRK